jgi:hypothetical protein
MRQEYWKYLEGIISFDTIDTNSEAEIVHNVFSLAENLKIFLSETTKPIEL